MAKSTIKLRLRVKGLDLVSKGFAVVFQRTRFTIRGVTLEPPIAGMQVRHLYDRAVVVTWKLPPVEHDFSLTVTVVGPPVVERERYLIVERLDQESSDQPDDGWTLVSENEAMNFISEAADPRKEVEDRRRKLMEDNTPLRLHRLFFLRMDEWTDRRLFGDPPALPAAVAPSSGSAVVLEALLAQALSNTLESWVKILEDTGDEMDLGPGYGFTQTEWIESMATYFRSVLEYAFQEAFGRPLATLVSGGTKYVLDEEFKVAFEEFANGNLGDAPGAPTSPLGFPDNAYYFSFAAFAWLAKKLATDTDEKRFWRAIWPVWAYTAEIYRLRYTPTSSGGLYDDYSFETFNAPVSPGTVARVPSMTRAAFRKILNNACSGC